MRLKLWEMENLPASGSLVAHRVFFHLVDAYNQGKPMTVKVLGLELPFSVAAIRIQLRKLQREGWINVEPGLLDSRQRTLSMSPRTEAVLHEYERQIIRLSRYGKQ
jgi:DNA-binding MarR family transcriptional regulator